MIERVTTAAGLLALILAVGWYAVPRLFPGEAGEGGGLGLSRIQSERMHLDRGPLPVPEEDREISAALAVANQENVGERVARIRLHLDERGETAFRRAALGWMLLLDQQVEAGRKELARALELDPDCPHALVASGYDHLRHGRFGPAETCLRQALEQYSGNATWQRLHSTVLLGTGRFGEALAAAENVVALAPKSPTSYLAVGDVHLREGRFAEALRWYGAACELAGPDSEITQKHQRVLDALRERPPF